MKIRGQSIIEYCIIMVLVILGIVFMGPYVLRSNNAHFKMWDDQVQDSFNDHLTQLPASAVNFPGGCQCNTAADGTTPILIQGSCGLVKGKTVTCQEGQRYSYGSCQNPATCSPSCADYCTQIEACAPDNSCCSQNYRGGCGNLPTTDTDPAHLLNNCPYGYRIIVNKCGSGSEKKIICPASDPLCGCVPDTTTADGDDDCSAKCTGALPVDATTQQPTAQFCSGATTDLIKDTPITLLGQNCMTISASNPNWTAPVGWTSATINVWGAGGGGAGGESGNGSYDGGGGGGGALAVANIPLQTGTSYNVTIGTGGASGGSGLAGGNGQTTSMVGGGLNISATGGIGGASAAHPTATAGKGATTTSCIGTQCQSYAGGNGGVANGVNPAGCGGGGAGGGGVRGIGYSEANNWCSVSTAGAGPASLGGGSGGTGANQMGGTGAAPGGGGAGGGSGQNGGAGGAGEITICPPVTCPDYSATPTAAKCEATCLPSYTLNEAGTGCVPNSCSNSVVKVVFPTTLSADCEGQIAIEFKTGLAITSLNPSSHDTKNNTDACFGGTDVDIYLKDGTMVVGHIGDSNGVNPANYQLPGNWSQITAATITATDVVYHSNKVQVGGIDSPTHWAIQWDDTSTHASGSQSWNMTASVTTSCS